MSIARDIMLNALMLAIPLLINFVADGAYDALKSGNISAILNLIAGLCALTASIIACFLYRIEKKNSRNVWEDIMARKEGTE